MIGIFFFCEMNVQILCDIANGEKEYVVEYIYDKMEFGHVILSTIYLKESQA